MVSGQNAAIDAQKSAPLKLDEPKVDPQNPWVDDLLGRQGIASRLTNLVATQAQATTNSWPTWPMGNRQDVYAQALAESLGKG